jgi:hypothetical protein
MCVVTCQIQTNTLRTAQVTLLTTAGSAKYVSFLQQEILKYGFFYLTFQPMLKIFSEGYISNYAHLLSNFSILLRVRVYAKTY